MMETGMIMMVVVNILITAIVLRLFWKTLTLPRHAGNSTGERWSTRTGLILAMAGNAVGLGNFLRFPVEAIKNGGGAFIIPYLVCFLLMGIPLMLVEWASGRFAGKKGIHDTPYILQSLSRHPFWKYVGALGLFTNIVVASYYIYVESWTLSYAFYGISGFFKGMSQVEVNLFFDQYTGVPNAVMVFSWLFCLLFNLYFLSKGIGKGIELIARIGMPILLLFGIILAVYGITIQAGNQGAVENGMTGLKYLWTPDFSSIWSAKVWLAAAGQIFFTLSVGVGAIQCYASYVSEKEDVVLNAMTAGWLNEFVEVVIGAAILIPISVGYLGLNNVLEIVHGSGSGFSLAFRTMPYLFQQWGSILGALASFMWFGVLFFAGVTSSLAMGWPFIGLMKDKFYWSTQKTTAVFGIIIFILGILPVFYFNSGAMGEFDYWAGQVALVVFASLELILFAWIFGMERGWAEIQEGADMKLPLIVKYIIQYVSPLFLLCILLGNISSWYQNLFYVEINTIQWISRLVMLGVFFGICLILFKAEQRKKKLS
ncbi:MAG: sodium-dependent transporter [Saprospiraceae bacterium]